jgi:2-(1,2-epoxy-1,2-dihydrophenyl)acetyl-CoA isomerase
LVGLQRATALMMLSDKVTAQEAEQMGLIYKSVEADIFDSYIQQLAERIVSMPAKALGMTKRLINLGLQNPLEKQLEIEGLLQVEAGNAPEYKEGVSAFLEKRSPNFKQLKTFS